MNRLSGISTILLSSLIVFVTICCLILFHGSPGFLTLLAVLFVVSAGKAVVSTSIQHERNKISDNIFKKIFQEKGLNYSPSSNQPKDHQPRYSDKEPAVDFSQYEQPVQEAPQLSLEQYLELKNFNLNDEIVDAIEWKRFELLCHLIFKATGFNSQLTGDGADEGVDIRIYDNNIEGKVLYLVQCKKWRKNQKIDRPLLQQLRGQMAAENVDKGGYCVTSSFTPPAQEFAAANDIELFDQKKIMNAFNKLDLDTRKTILKELLQGDYWTPSCASCGRKFQATRLKSEKMVWGCNNSSKHGWSSISYYEASPIANVR